MSASWALLGDEHLRRLTDILQVGIGVVDSDGRVRFSNPRARELIGLSEEELLARRAEDPWWDIVDANGAPLSPEQIGVMGTFAGRSVVDLVLGVKHTKSVDRTWILLRADPFELPGQGVRQAIVSFTDITALRQSEAARAAALQEVDQFREALDEVPAYVYIKDRQSRYQYGNARTLQLFGVSAADLVGRSDEDFFPADTVARLRAVDARVLRGERTHEEITARRADGSQRIYLEVKAPLASLGSDGQPTGLLGISIDVTAERTLADQFRQAQKMESVGRLAGGIAHDFNNMLSVILGHAELASGALAADSPVRDEINEIAAAARRSADLTRQLLAFARKQTLSPRPIDLNAEVNRSAALLARLVTEEIPLRVDLADSVWSVLLDPGQLDQILANLAVNARDAIREARRLEPLATRLHHITISTENHTLSPERAAAEHVAAGDFVRLSVRDTGCGMSAEVRAMIFEPFYTTKPVGEGTGLGLSMVIGAVTQSGGFVSVQSEPGKGSTFEIFLPRHDEAVSARPTRAPAAVPSDGHETVLVVEDEPAVLKLTSTALRRLGYTILAAASPAEALRIVESHTGRLDLLISDMIMPGMNGLQLAQAIEERRPGLKRLFVSGYTADALLGSDMAVEQHLLLSKPFTMSAFAAKVREALERP